MFRISNKVSIPINQDEIENKDFIPKEVGFEDTRHVMEQVGIAMNYNMPVLLVAQTGVGKTSMVRHLACKTKNAFVRVNHNGGTSIEDIVGRYLIDDKGTRWQDGILIEAMKKGYWFLADEINAASAEINFIYHQLLDDDARVIMVEKGHEVVIPHPNFRFFAAMNPTSDYAGTKELNKALLSRFTVIKMDYVSPSIEEKILIERTKVPADVAKAMVKFAVDIRSGHAKGTRRFALSTRDLIMWGQMYTAYGKYIVSAESTVLNKVPDDEFESIKDLIGLHFKKLDEGIKFDPKDLEKPKKLEVGARIRLLKEFSMQTPKGIEGIIAVDGDDITDTSTSWKGNWGINFEKNVGGHNLMGKLPESDCRNGLFVPKDIVELI